MLTLNGQVLRIERFPNNEARFKDFDDIIEKGENILEFRYENDSDLMNLQFAKDYMDEFSNTQCILFIWYMPYSRMDRKIEGDLFTLKSVCKFMNRMNFKRIVVMEPHSDKTLLMLKNATPVYPIKDWLGIVKEEIGFAEEDAFVLPDKGAVSRYGDVIKGNVCIIEKQRNPITCTIEGMYLKEGTITPGAKYIILDDLCSRGGTALGAANILKDGGAGKVYVAVSHLEEAALSSPILSKNSPVTKIFATKSITSQPHPKVRYMDIDVNAYI